MRVIFEAKRLLNSIEISTEITKLYENVIAEYASEILTPLFLSEIEAIVIPENFIEAVLCFQRDHNYREPSVTNNEYGTAFGKMMQNPQSKKYYVYT